MNNLELIDVAIKALQDLKSSQVDKVGVDLTEVEQGKFHLEVNVFHEYVGAPTQGKDEVQYMGME